MLAVARRIAFTFAAATLLAGGFGAVAWAKGGSGGGDNGRGDEETTQVDDQDTNPAATTMATKPEHGKAHHARAASPAPAPAIPQTTAAPPTVRQATAGSRTIASTRTPKRSSRARPQVVDTQRGHVLHARTARRVDPPAKRAPKRAPAGRRPKAPLRSSEHAVALPVAAVSAGDHPRDRLVPFLTPRLASWVGIAGALVLLVVGAVLGAGVWAKRRVLKL